MNISVQTRQKSLTVQGEHQKAMNQTCEQEQLREISEFKSGMIFFFVLARFHDVKE